MKLRGTIVNPKSSKYMYIDKSESENMNRNGVESLSTNKHAINTSMDKTSCASSNYRFMRLIRQGDNQNKETLIYLPYTPCRHHLSSYNLSFYQSNRISVSGAIIVSQKSNVIKHGVNSGHNTWLNDSLL